MTLLSTYVHCLYRKDKINNGKSTSPIITANIPSMPQVTSTQKLDDPPTKLIKLINGSAILAPMDSKENSNKQMLHSGQLTLQQVSKMLKINLKNLSIQIHQVVGGGGLVVSPIQLLASSQGFKVINQPNGLTTIELSPQSKFLLKYSLGDIVKFSKGEILI